MYSLVALFPVQMILKNLSENARSLAANARIEDMSRLIRNHMAGKQDVKNALTGVMVNVYKMMAFIYLIRLR